MPDDKAIRQVLFISKGIKPWDRFQVAVAIAEKMLHYDETKNVVSVTEFGWQMLERFKEEWLLDGRKP